MGRLFDALERARRERDGAGPAPPPPPAGSPGAPPPAGIDEALRTIHDAHAPVTEQLRHIRTHLETVMAGQATRAVVVSSPVAGDGKTLIAANLAAVLADRPGPRVLLVDADMRRPELHRMLSVPPAPGLSEALSDRAGVHEVLYETAVPNLSLLPAGREPRDPSVLLGSERMRAMLGELARRFAWVVFDAPPLLTVADAAALGRLCSGLLLVVRIGRTPYAAIARAQDLLAEMRLPVIGCILNDMPPARRRRGADARTPGGA